MDLPLILYLSISLVSSYGFFLFLWGCTRARKDGWHVSVIYIYLMLLFGAVASLMCVNAYARYLRVCGQIDEYLSVMGSCWWAPRLYFLLIILILIVGHMTCKAIRANRRLPPK